MLKSGIFSGEKWYILLDALQADWFTVYFLKKRTSLLLKMPVLVHCLSGKLLSLPILVSELVSRQGEFHSKPLAEPYLKLSLHTAPIIKLSEVFLPPSDKTNLVYDMILLTTNYMLFSFCERTFCIFVLPTE